jgi:hypothetical protein
VFLHSAVNQRIPSQQFDCLPRALWYHQVVASIKGEAKGGIQHIQSVPTQKASQD